MEYRLSVFYTSEEVAADLRAMGEAGWTLKSFTALLANETVRYSGAQEAGRFMTTRYVLVWEHS